MRFELDHFAIGVRAVDAAGPQVERWFGAAPGDGGPARGFFWKQWSFANDAVLELIEPSGPPGFMHRFIERHGPGVHHVTFRVPSLSEAAERARRAGYEVVGYDDSHPGWKECFLHPKQAQGIVVQLAESAGAHEAAVRTSDGANGVQLVALRLRARSEDAARAQWERLLGADATRADGKLCFRWLASPIAIAVRVAPDEEHGPDAIELTASKAPSLDVDEAKTLFGTRFEIA